MLDGITPALRENIRERGHEFVEKFSKLQEEFPHVITKVQGAGLLCSAELEPTRFQWLARKPLNHGAADVAGCDSRW